MNAKQTVPLIATLAPTIGPLIPPLLVVGGLVLVVKWLFFDGESEKKTETLPSCEIPRKAAEIPVIPPVSATAMPKMSPPTRAWLPVQIPAPSAKQHRVTRREMASIFRLGTQALTRTQAVAALKAIGFGKTAAYQALSNQGRFASWLQFAPDGLIGWRD